MKTVPFVELYIVLCDNSVLSHSGRLEKEKGFWESVKDWGVDKGRVRR